MHIVKNTPQTRENRPLRHTSDLERHVMSARDTDRRTIINRIVSQRQHAH